MPQKAILFDLDGTLTDSGEGIINCATLALEHFGLPIPTREEMRVFVGPPLPETFRKFGIPEEKIDEAIAVFRSRYTTVGIFENRPYPGIRELLEKLKKDGHRLFVATSKPEVMAHTVLNKFELSQYFELICGGTLDESRLKKADIIAYLLKQVNDTKNVVMIGDTHFDVTGAAVHSIPTIGVTWGYGEKQDMLDAGAVAIVDSPEALYTLLS